MIPPTSIDGTDITGATIDGTDVTEITVDGQTVFSPGLPGPAPLHRWDATALTGFSNNDPVTSIPDIAGNVNLSRVGNDGIYKSSEMNGQPAIEIDSSSFFEGDVAGENNAALTHFYVFKFIDLSQFLYYFYQNDSQGKNGARLNFNPPNLQIYHGQTLTNNNFSSSGVNVITAVFNQANSVFRINGGNQVTGNTGSRSSVGEYSIGAAYSGSASAPMFFSEWIVYDSALSSSDYLAIEQFLVDKY